MDILQFLQQQGISRRHIVNHIKHGDISVNTICIQSIRYALETGDTVCIQDSNGDKKKYTVGEKRTGGHIILFNKPIGYVVSKNDSHNETIYDILPDGWKNTYTYIGRLDKDSHGLLVLTDIPQLVSLFAHPRHHHIKTYVIKTAKPITTNDIQIGKQGIDYHDSDEHKTHLLQWENCKQVALNTYKITLSAGKKRHIRRLIEALENNVIDLQRVGFGPRVLDNIPVGEWNIISLSSEDLESLGVNQSSYIQKQI